MQSTPITQETNAKSLTEYFGSEGEEERVMKLKSRINEFLWMNAHPSMTLKQLEDIACDLHDKIIGV